MTPLPIELLELIISHAWHFPAYSAPLPPRFSKSSLLPHLSPTSTPYTLSVQERIHLMLALPLTSKSFLSMYLRVSSRDVYIPSPSYAEHWMQRIVMGFNWPESAYRPLWLAVGCSKRGEFLDVVCESVNFVLDPRSLGMAKSSMPVGVLESMVNRTLYQVNCSNNLPEMRTVGIEILEREIPSGRAVISAKKALARGGGTGGYGSKGKGLMGIVEEYVVEDMLADCVPPQVRVLEVVYHIPTGCTRIRRVSL